ncbi:hypothetical protein J2T02_004093 [Chitinophaga terrae (ex Kim and Jung 2007)]|uniref:hypothetical protein n=1 Tax=Chitinophaga terrae (ex Kim and Jung 2007) TaxID=408074 RepID=UPI002788C2FA|nr:hypothetical protein [Chitinophaga terrae (ex Kim and Jung 2007)]MDQ0108952.1 hypothetical protein [Chitinophaga terrae (ex Kim and Jung 2007)]
MKVWKVWFIALNILYIPCLAQQKSVVYENKINKSQDVVNGNKTVNNYYKNDLKISPLDLDFSIKKSDFSDTPDVILLIKNLGNIDVERVKIFFTLYFFDKDSTIVNNQFRVKKEFLSWSSALGQVRDDDINHGQLKKGKEIRVKVNKYIPMTHNFPPAISDSNYNFMVPVIRITFKNSITKDKFVKYIICNAFTKMPLIFEDQEMLWKAGITSSAGKILDKDGKDPMADFRQFIYNNQASMFGDTPSQIYRN